MTPLFWLKAPGGARINGQSLNVGIWQPVFFTSQKNKIVDHELKTTSKWAPVRLPYHGLGFHMVVLKPGINLRTANSQTQVTEKGNPSAADIRDENKCNHWQRWVVGTAVSASSTIITGWLACPKPVLYQQSPWSGEIQQTTLSIIFFLPAKERR